MEQNQNDKLCLIYQGNYNIYQRGGLFCILPQDTKQSPPSMLSLSESFKDGVSYLFCKAPNSSDFPSKILAYLTKWQVMPLFLWVTNPSEDICYWITQKIERIGLKQRLLFDSYFLELDLCRNLSIQDENFVFNYETGNFVFGCGTFRLNKSAQSLYLLTLEDDCGTFSGSLNLAQDIYSSFMEKINAGIYFSRCSETNDLKAQARGFLDSVYSPVLKLQTAQKLNFKLTPHLLLDKDHSFFSLAGFEFESMLVTRTGQTIKLTAQPDSCLVFQQRPILSCKDIEGKVSTKKSLYLGLCGSFRIKPSFKLSQKTAYLQDQTKDIAQNQNCNNEHLLCGLAGTETIVLQDNACLNFCPSMPAVDPYCDSSLGTTSWIGSVGGGNYYCQPKQSVLYGDSTQSTQALRYIAHNSNQASIFLRMLDIPAASFENNIPHVPILPHLSLSLKGEHNEIMWEESLYLARYNKLTNDVLNNIFMTDKGSCAITPQGLMANISQDGHYNWLGIATFKDTTLGNKPDLYFCNIDHKTKSILQQQEILYVIDNKQAFDNLKASDGFCFTLEGIKFNLLSEWITNTDHSTMLIMQYSATRNMREALKDNDVFQHVCNTAYNNDGQIKSEYAELIAAVEDPNFEGILALNVPISIDNLPSEIQFLMNTIDKSQFYAAFLLIKAGKIQLNEQGQPVLKASLVAGLIDYSSEVHLSYKNEPPDYDYLTTNIRIRIQNNQLIEFFSSSELLVNRLFDTKIQSSNNHDGNCLILQGKMVTKDQTKVFQYELKNEVLYTLKGSGINTVLVNKVDLVTNQNGSGQFQLAGTISSNAIEGADILGFGGNEDQEGLPFAQLTILMQTDAKGAFNKFLVDYGQLLLFKDQATLREGSFPQKFAVQLESILLEKNGETPEQKGFITINAPIQQSIPPACYQGFIWTLNVGSLGGLSNKGIIQLRLLTAFWEGADGSAEYYLGMQIPDMEMINTWKLQGLFQIGFDSVSIDKNEDSYIIKLHGFQIHILGTSFPEDNSDIVLFSDSKQIGWYAAYKEK